MDLRTGIAVLAAVGIVLAVAAGLVLTNPGLNPWYGEDSGAALVARHVETAPAENLVVNASDERIRDVELIQRVLHEADTTDGPGVINISDAEKERLSDILPTLPHTQTGGPYIRYNGTVYEVYIIVPLSFSTGQHQPPCRYCRPSAESPSTIARSSHEHFPSATVGYRFSA